MVEKFSDEWIARVVEHARDPKNWRPAEPGARERGRRIAARIADTFTDDQWRRVLNSVPQSRAADKISRRPVEDRPHLLSLVDADRRAEVEALLTATV